MVPMILTEQQKQTIDLLNPWQSGKSIELGIPRTAYLDTISNTLEHRRQILFLLGSRRVGKTMILFQLIYRQILNKVKAKKILFLSLDNSNLQDLDLFSYLSQSDFDFIFLDEVHFFPNWAQVLKSLYDIPTFKTKIICSGSSSKSIEDSKAFLTGRSTTINIYPLSFIEFQDFNSSANQLQDYLYYGGYPEYVLEKQPNYLNELLRDVIEKDILKLHTIQNSKYLFDICQILAKQIGFRGSSNKISNVLGLDNKTVNNYIEYLHEVRLVETVYQYSDNLNEQLYAPKKYYYNDLGMRNSFVGFSDIGSLAENAIFIKLVETYGRENIYYLSDSDSNEIDFVIKIAKDKLILVESKHNNLKESVLNSISKAFLSNYYNKEIVQRMVITDGVNANATLKDVTIRLIGLKEFLTNNT